MSAQLTITQPAINDIEQIADYLAAESGLARSEKFLSNLYGKFAKIARFPTIGRKRSELLPRARSLSIENYIILYIVDGANISIMRVVSGYRDLNALFDD